MEAIIVYWSFSRIAHNLRKPSRLCKQNCFEWKPKVEPLLAEDAILRNILHYHLMLARQLGKSQGPLLLHKERTNIDSGICLTAGGLSIC